jgi:hypothetical protein
VVAVGVGFLLTLASSAVPSRRLEIQDWDCPPPPTSCARPVVVLGFPVPYISDYHGISPVGRASLVDALLGIDHFHVGAFAFDLALYAFAVAGAWAGARALRTRLPWRSHRNVF